MSDRTAYSDILDLPAATKLLNSLRKPGKTVNWTDWSGSGGAEISSKIERVAGDQINSIILPDHCTSFSISSWDYICFERCEVPKSLFLGGDDWFPPDFGGCGEVRFYFMPRGFNKAVSLRLSKQAGMRWFEREYDKCLEISMGLGNLLYLISLDEVNANCGSEESLMKLWKIMFLPDEQADGFLEAVHYENSHDYYFDPLAFPASDDLIRQVVNKLIDESPIKRLYVWGQAELGGQALLSGQSVDVTESARDLLVKVAAQKSYSLYDISFSYLGPRSWRDRERSRKKWKKAIHEELGTVTWENGAMAKASLGIEKDGYIIYLIFDSDDDLIEFTNSKMFQKTKWHSGAK